MGLNAFAGVLTFLLYGLKYYIWFRKVNPEIMCKVSKLIMLQFLCIEKLRIFCLDHINQKCMSLMCRFRVKFSPDQYTILLALVL